MVDCPNCGADKSHGELIKDQAYSTGDSTYVILQCPDCKYKGDYSEWGAFGALYD